MRSSRLILLSFILLIILPLSGRVYGGIPAEERAALIVLYTGTNGDNWADNSGWKTPPLAADGFAAAGSEDNWFGITVLGSHVLKIRLSHNQLSGSLPPGLGNLSELEELYLDHNQLTGAIPPQWGDLWKLEILYLCSNQLEGSIPPELGNLAELEELYLYSNQLTGPIPLELGNLANLGVLYLYSNQLEGSIPPELANLSKLTDLRLYDNRLTESIPMELGMLSKLRYLFLHANQLSGPIPQQLGNLSNLVELNLRSNRLRGEIPSSLVSLPDLADNRSDFRWNALYTNDEILKTFLESKQEGGNWENTQTVAPKGVAAQPTSTTSIMVSWRPIAYTGDSGSYRVYYRSTPGPPYNFCCATADKTASEIEVTGLSENTPYYFVVQTRTQPHDNNSSPLDSDYSITVLESTSGNFVRISGRVTTTTGAAIGGVTLTFSNNGGTAETNASGDYSRSLPNGWSGTVTPSKPGFTFYPSSKTYTAVTANRSGENYTGTSSSIPISGRVTIARDNGIEGLSGVTLTFSYQSSEPDETVKTDADGFYSHEVRPGWAGTVEPSLPRHGFLPPVQVYQGVQSPMRYQNYTATDDRPVISGRITVIDPDTGEPKGLAGVQMTFYGRDGTGTGKTNDNGYYRYTVDYGWSGTVEPAKAGYHFFPPANSYDNVNESRLCENYEAFSGTIELKLTASWEVDDTLFIAEHYGKLELTVDKSDEIQVSKYIIFRKEEDNAYEVSVTIPAADISRNVPYSYNNRGLDKDKKYTYMARAYNLNNEPIAQSEEVSIQVGR